MAVGARPAIAVRKPWQVERARTALGAHPGLVAEVGSHDGEAAAGFAKGAHDALGPIEGLIATCGRFAAGPIHKAPAGEDLELFEANVLSIHNVVRAVAGPMIRRKSGKLIFVGSAAVGSEATEMALYRASKAALHEYASALSRELWPHGIAVALAAPTTLDTAANRAAMPTADRSDWQSCEAVAERLIAACGSALGTASEPLVRLPLG
jgi:short-subunit dehydrogenase